MPRIRNTTPERLTRRERRKAMTREKVFQAAKKLFAEQGYNETRSGDIASFAGVSHGTVFSHFKSKSDILECLQEELLQTEFQRLEQLDTSGLSCESSLKLMMNALWQGAMDNTGTIRAMQARSWLWNGAREDVYQRLSGRIRDLGAGFLERGQCEGQISPDLDVHLTMEIIDSVTRECIRKSTIQPDNSVVYLTRLNRTIELICHCCPHPERG